MGRDQPSQPQRSICMSANIDYRQATSSLSVRCLQTMQTFVTHH